MSDREEFVESLKMMREMARDRVKQLESGITTYTPERQNHYLKEYRSKIKELDIEIRRYSIRAI
ncbi:hypothetical protein LPW11_02080 [Geomonas sp. RF6]|uniref:hypothetical protein n=1 Tax=Geomonas sp. RF6 TaxID=2897342 RepID=UPI001E525D0B|nr:hypothetical protein [Geomonas sp. RF6]UFS70985.1 hypothetical protein LPW11_02080 [Geomonas sp. RF6]